MKQSSWHLVGIALIGLGWVFIVLGAPVVGLCLIIGSVWVPPAAKSISGSKPRLSYEKIQEMERWNDIWNRYLDKDPDKRVELADDPQRERLHRMAQREGEIERLRFSQSKYEVHAEKEVARARAERAERRARLEVDQARLEVDQVRDVPVEVTETTSFSSGGVVRRQPIDWRRP